MIRPILRILGNRAVASLIFWAWNLLFLCIVFAGIVPNVLPDLFWAVTGGLIRLEFLTYGLAFVFIPLASVILGITVLRRSPDRLLILGYGIQGPLMLICFIRFFFVRQMTPSMACLISVSVIGLAGLLWDTLDSRKAERPFPLPHLRCAALVLLFLAGAYAFIWISFYTVPAIARFAPEFGRVLWGLTSDLRRVRDLLLSLIVYLPFMILSGIFFVFLPIALVLLYGHSCSKALRSLSATFGSVQASVVKVTTVLGCLGVYLASNQQPQGKIFKLLENPPKTREQAEALLQQSDFIKAGLLNAYLAQERYLGCLGQIQHISSFYQESFHLTRETADMVQIAYNVLAKPVLYEGGSFDADEDKAEALYRNLFDSPIDVAEREVLKDAARSNWSMDRAKEALLAVDDREVWLARQEVSVREQGDSADITIHETYENTTWDRQEVVYVFSLPESATITGLWLGPDPDRDKCFRFRVSPRGAAQQVYQEQIVTRVDPALLEQVGPRQYRLRAFPVEPLQGPAGKRHAQGAPLHLWMSYRTVAVDSSWPLPRLSHHVNVFWDARTVRVMNGKTMPSQDLSWLPPDVPCSKPCDLPFHIVTFPTGGTVSVAPISKAGEDPRPQGLRLAVLLDTSLSMKQRQEDLSDALESFRRSGSSLVDVYIFPTVEGKDRPMPLAISDVQMEDVFFFGEQRPLSLIQLFEKARGNRTYDAIFLLTDEGTFGLPKEPSILIPEAPVWLIHLAEALPAGYDDSVLEIIESTGGGVVCGAEEALSRLATDGTEGDSIVRDLDGWRWTISPNSEATWPQSVDDPWAPMAARQLIYARTRKASEVPLDVPALDALHQIAKEQGIVTPYSSMVVLVTERQEKRLDDLETNGDRYDREAERIGETAPPELLNVMGVPEPEEWILLAIAGVMLFWWKRRRRLAISG